MRIFLLLIALCIAPAQSQEPPQAPKVKSEQQTKGAAKIKENASAKESPSGNSLVCSPSLVCNSPEPKPGAKGEHGGEEGTEFWPAVLGYRLKITDTLLVAFTALLFFATLFLYWATRDLVGGADDTARHELRAYVGITEGKISLVENGKCLRVDLKIVNSGQTPANNVRLAFDSSIRDYAPTGDIPPLPAFRKGRAYMMPRSKWDVHTSIRQIDIAALDAIDGGKKEVLIWGCVEYTDIYGRGQNSFFCYRRGWRIGDGVPYIWDIEPNYDGNKAT